MGILNVGRTYKLTPTQEGKLFEAAKSADHFEPKMLAKYAKQLKSGNNNFMKTVRPLKHVRVDVLLDQKEYDALVVKYVDDGPFNSVSALFKAILRGEKSVRVALVNEK